MDTHLSIHEQQRMSQVTMRQQDEAEAEVSGSRTVVRLIIVANFYTIAAIVLVLMRVAGRIDWPWAPVTAPLWVPVLLTALLAAIFGLATMIMNSFSR